MDNKACLAVCVCVFSKLKKTLLSRVSYLDGNTAFVVLLNRQRNGSSGPDICGSCKIWSSYFRSCVEALESSLHFLM